LSDHFHENAFENIDSNFIKPKNESVQFSENENAMVEMEQKIVLIMVFLALGRTTRRLITIRMTTTTISQP
jgi:hypothetical protein